MVAPSCSAEEGAAGGEAAGQESRIDCALAGAPEFSRDCAVERADVDGRRYLVVRHPDGGFRRLEVQGDRIVVADGAQEAHVASAGDTRDLTIGEDRYRIPARLTADAAR